MIGPIPEGYEAFERLQNGRYVGLIQLSGRLWRIVTGGQDWQFYDDVW